MPAKSKSQQQFFAIALAVKAGKRDPSTVTADVRQAADDMTMADIKDFASTKTSGLPKKVKKEERDYKDEYKKFQSSPKAKKYRAELNKYNRQHGTYGNGDGKDASHKGGKISGYESESKNRGRAEKSRVKSETFMKDLDVNRQLWDEYRNRR